MAVAILLCVLVLAFCGTVQAEQFRMDGKQIGPPPPSVEAKLDAQLTGRVRAVIDQYRVYQVGTKLRGCFFGGDQEVRKLFVEVAAEWDALAPGISIDFGDNGYTNCSEDPDDPLWAQMRVAFESGGDYSGSWSRLGTLAAEGPMHEPSINIGDVVAGRLKQTLLWMSEESLKATMRHEIGHALTLQHEHASPKAKCEEEFLWEEVVYPALAKPPNNWERDEVDAQLRRLTQSERLRATDYDPKSIMHYEVPANWLRNGINSPCYVTGNIAISDTDAQAIAAVYPESQLDQEKYLTRLGGLARHLASELKIDTDTARAMEDAIGDALPNQLRGRGLVPNIQQCVVGDIKWNEAEVQVEVGKGGCVINVH